MAKPLTGKQEAFVLAHVRLRNASAAYREVYNVSKMTAKTVNEEACRLLANPKVAARLAELTAPAIEAAGLTIERTLEHIARGAYAEPSDKIKWSEKVACLDKGARILGMYGRDNAQRADNILIKIIAVA